MEVIVGQKVQHQLVFIGSFGVGKTTAVKSLSDIDIVSMEATANIEIRAANLDSGKKTTTIGFDYGEFFVNEDEKISLYGIPGQARFEQVWDNLLPRCSGVVLWVFANKDNYLHDCEKWLKVLQHKKAVKKLAVALTRISPENQEAIDTCRGLVAKYHPYAPVLTADPRDRHSVLQATIMALSTPYPD